MNNTTELNPHEMLELHEIIRSKVTCAKKTEANLSKITDPEFKSFMQDSLQLKKAALNRLHEFYDGSVQQQ